ncbi:SNF2 family N-terminal domain-containing protein [Xylariales sp. AK1849]|nr:SNF2 family N-terminal domain-containing protein [Xylariales sp. AK1849]
MAWQQRHRDQPPKRPLTANTSLGASITPPSNIKRHKSDVSVPTFQGYQLESLGADDSRSLPDLQIRIGRIRAEDLLALLKVQSDNNTLFCVQLFIDDNLCQIRTQTGTFIGDMNTKTHQALKSLSVAHRLLYTGLIRQTDLQGMIVDTSSLLPSRSPNANCLMDLVICGPGLVADDLARGLSKFRLFLQHPAWLPPESKYENPQYLGLVGSRLLPGTVLPPICIDIDAKNIEDALATTDGGKPIMDAADILNHIPAYNDLKEVDVDDRIMTQLHRYQKEGVDFVISSPFTGVRSPVAKDALGGILADDMGLGKTITMICAIVSSLRSATEFSLLRTGPPQNSDCKAIPVKSTLVIVPSVLLLDTWIEEIEKHVTKGTLTYYKYHGTSRRLSTTSPIPYDIVLSTYSSIAADYSRGGGVLKCFEWYRIILDEAHIVRNSSTRQFKAVTSLLANIRWCLTGTPIQNTVEDLGSLIKFLRLPILDDTATFRKHIIGRNKITGTVSKRGFENLQLLLGSLCLRRTSSVLSALGVTFKEYRQEFSAGERDAYDKLGADCRRSLDAAVNSASTKKAHHAILEGLLRLRMFCNNGTETVRLQDPFPFRSDEAMSILQQSESASCAICSAELFSFDHDDITGTSPHLTGCPRLICAECLPQFHGEIQSKRAQGDMHCSLCGDIDSSSNKVLVINSTSSLYCGVSSEPETYPTKILTLLDDIKTHYYEEKSIIFSFWKSSLDLIETIFLREGVKFRRVDGSLHTSQRVQRLLDFRQDPSIRVLLMTLGTEAAGLNNLSVASRLHLLEPQWNPSVERQAVGRIMRLGQDRKVTIVRYIMKASVEESVQSRQVQKLHLASAGGLQSSDCDNEDRRKHQLQELGRIIQGQIGRALE